MSGAKAFLHLIRENFNFQESADNVSKRTKTSVSDLSREEKGICDTIICQIKDRFKFTGHLIAAILFLPERFDHYDTNFPDKNLNEACKLNPFLNIKNYKRNLLYYTALKIFVPCPGP